MPTERLKERSLERSLERPLYLSTEMLLGMVFMHRYRFLTIPQFARVAGLSLSHTREVLRRLHYRGPGHRQQCP